MWSNSTKDWSTNGFPSSFRIKNCSSIYDSRINFVQIGGLQHVASSWTVPLCAKHHENISVPQHSARSPEERSGFAAKGSFLKRLWRNVIVTKVRFGSSKSRTMPAQITVLSFGDQGHIHWIDTESTPRAFIHRNILKSLGWGKVQSKLILLSNPNPHWLIDFAVHVCIRYHTLSLSLAPRDRNSSVGT